MGFPLWIYVSNVSVYMNWNQSNGNNQDPWGNGSNKNGPPELDQLIQALLKRLRQLFGIKTSLSPKTGRGSVSFIAGIIAMVVLVIWLGAGFFIVGPAEQAVVLRFGRYVKTLDAGPHWVPRFIDSYTKINVQQVNAFDISEDLLTKSSDKSEKPKQAVQLDKADEVNVKNDDTDKNVVYVEMSAQYRISDPRLFLFNVADGVGTLKNVVQSALSEVVGNMQLNDVLTVGRDELASAVAKRTQELMQQYQTGVELVVINIRKAQAPEEVADAFLEVVQAGQDEQRYIQQAQAYASKVIPIAEGVQSRILADASAYKQQVVLNAQANVANYNALLRVYRVSPQVTRERLYLETMQSVLTHSSKLLVDTKGAQNLMYLPLDKLFEKAKALPPADEGVHDDMATKVEALTTRGSGRLS